MAKMKKSTKEIISNIKEREQLAAKSNYTFRLSDETMRKFKDLCNRHSISMASVVDDLIKDFIDENRERN